jgi:hypothetical protein
VTRGYLLAVAAGIAAAAVTGNVWWLTGAAGVLAAAETWRKGRRRYEH